MLATERPKIDRLTDQLNALSQHADDTIQNVNGTVSDAREPVRKDLTELQNTGPPQPQSQDTVLRNTPQRTGISWHI
jgi:ABC-type transporter Mla subunit MlaD